MYIPNYKKLQQISTHMHSLVVPAPTATCC